MFSHTWRSAWHVDTKYQWNWTYNTIIIEKKSLTRSNCWVRMRSYRHVVCFRSISLSSSTSWFILFICVPQINRINNFWVLFIIRQEIFYFTRPKYGFWTTVRGSGLIPEGVWEFNLYPGTVCVSFICALYCVVSGRAPDIL